MANEDERNVSRFEREEIENQIDINNPGEAIEPDLPVFELSSANQNKLALVVGHTRLHQGAEAVEPIDRFEYTWNKELAEKIKLACGLRNIACGVFYRDGVGIEGAYKQVLSWNPSRCIELHFNSYTSPVEGTETLYGIEDLSEGWARTVQEGMVKTFSRTGASDRGVKLRKAGQRGHKSLTQLVNIPNCLVEPFFGNSTQDSALAALKVDSYVESIVEAFQLSIHDESLPHS